MNDYGQIDLGTAATECACDAITLEIVRGALRATQSEMEALIERTAMSPFIREKKNFYAALFDGEGQLIVGSNLPIFGDPIGPILERYPRATMREGDIYWYNDCYASHGAVSHSPDQAFAYPVFCGEEIVAFAQSSAHFNDIGGMRAGSLSPDCEEIFQEGISATAKPSRNDRSPSTILATAFLLSFAGKTMPRPRTSFSTVLKNLAPLRGSSTISGLACAEVRCKIALGSRLLVNRPSGPE